MTAYEEVESEIANAAKEQILDITKKTQKVFYNKFQKFVKAQPDSQFTGMFDITVKYDELMKKFVAEVTGEKK